MISKENIHFLRFIWIVYFASLIGFVLGKWHSYVLAFNNPAYVQSLNKWLLLDSLDFWILIDYPPIIEVFFIVVSPMIMLSLGLRLQEKYEEFYGDSDV